VINSTPLFLARRAAVIADDSAARPSSAAQEMQLCAQCVPVAGDRAVGGVVERREQAAPRQSREGLV
jgi:hypothetical protein